MTASDTLAERISRALESRCPESNRTGWRSWLAERMSDLGYREDGKPYSSRTIERIQHGQTTAQGDTIDALVAVLGAAFRDEIFPCEADPVVTPEDALDVLRRFVQERAGQG